jgi:hypothetical protein
VTSPRIQPPHKTLRKAVNTQKLRCIDRLAYLKGCDGISKTTMWKNVGNCADANAFPEAAKLALSRAFKSHENVNVTGDD